MSASWLGYDEIVECLLENHASIDEINDHSTTALSPALRNEHFPVAKRLLKAGANKDLALERVPTQKKETVERMTSSYLSEGNSA